MITEICVWGILVGVAIVMVSGIAGMLGSMVEALGDKEFLFAATCLGFAIVLGALLIGMIAIIF